MNHLSQTGRYCFGGAVAASGLMQVINGEFVRLVPKLPAWIPVQSAWPMVTGGLLVLIGCSLLTGYRVRIAALVLAVLLLGSFLGQRIPEILSNPGVGFMWTNPIKVLALFGGAMILACGDGIALLLAAWLLGIFLLICGVQHFDYAGFVDTLVPAWIPPGPRFWTYFSGTALLAGGIGVLLPKTRRLAGMLSGVMIFLWVVLLHVPRTIQIKSAFELAGVFEALAIAGVAWILAGASGSFKSAAPASVSSSAEDN